MTDMTNYLETKVINHILGLASFTMPATAYLALFTADPGESGSLTNEVGSGVGYARQNLTAAMDASTGGGPAVNDTAIVFGPCSTTSWGTITHAAVVDAGTSGNILMKRALQTPKLIEVGDGITFRIGELSILFD